MNRCVGLVALLAAIVAFSGSAWAEKDELILKNGNSGFVEVVKTTKDSLDVKGSVQGSGVAMTLKASQLDPHSFYELRRKHMESTAQSHWDLALFCVDNGMFNRAKHEATVAESIDPEFVAKQKAMPEVREGVAESVLRLAKFHLEADKLDQAKQELSILLTKLSDTQAAGSAEAMLTVIERRAAKLEAEEDAAAAKALTEEQKKADEEILKKFKPARILYEYAKELVAKAMREKNENNAKSGFAAAGGEFEKALAKARSVVEKLENEDVAGRFATIEKRVMGEAVDAYINAGRIDMNRGSYSSAEKYAEKALGVDPTSQAAKSFKSEIGVASAMGNDWGVRGINRVGGGRRGGGRR
jgi:tetratricopeptide (TPR) repeat protein